MKGYYFAKSVSGQVACNHQHRTFAAARKCADAIEGPAARVVFVPKTTAPHEVTGEVRR